MLEDIALCAAAAVVLYGTAYLVVAWLGHAIELFIDLVL